MKNKIEFSKGLSVDIIKKISEIRSEPKWLLDIRLSAFNDWQKMKEPHWAGFEYKPIDYQDIIYYAKPNPIKKSDSQIETIYDKLGIPEHEKKALLGMAVDTVLDSESVATSYKEILKEKGIIFLPFSKAIKEYPDLVKKYMCSVVPTTDNFFSCLNTAVFSDGTFVYIPKNTKCPIDLASYFRIHTANIGQFERTLIIADSASELSYLEGCSAPRKPNHQLHSGVVEIVVKDKAKVKYTTVQNWYSGDANGNGGILNFVTKRGLVEKDAKLLWTQLETGSAKTWKYPSSILKGDNSVSDFYSLTISKDSQDMDTGTKMIHIGNNTKSNVVARGIALGKSNQIFRSLVSFTPKTMESRNNTICDSVLVDNARIQTIPTLIQSGENNISEHEAKVGKLSEDELFYLESFGLDADSAMALIVSGMSSDILSRLPAEFLIESKSLIKLCISNNKD